MNIEKQNRGINFTYNSNRIKLDKHHLNNLVKFMDITLYKNKEFVNIISDTEHQQRCQGT